MKTEIERLGRQPGMGSQTKRKTTVNHRAWQLCNGKNDLENGGA
jgi:hypothetical protein